MKRLSAALVVILLVSALMPMSVQAKVDREPGGIPAFLVGCCWGIREGTEWNEGADMHWREWFRIVPFVGLVIGIWDGADCYSGTTARDWAKKNGANWY